MDNVSFTIEEENLICIYHKHDHRRTIAAISDALPDMDADMRPLAEQTIQSKRRRGARQPMMAAASRVFISCNEIQWSFR